MGRHSFTAENRDFFVGRGDDRGDGGVVLCGKMTRTAVNLRSGADSDVFDLAHDAFSFALLIVCAGPG